MRWSLSRRSWLQAAGVSFGLGALGFRRASGQAPNPHDAPVLGHAGHALGVVGEADTEIFDPRAYLTAFNFSHLPEPDRSRYYRETLRLDPNHQEVRKYLVKALKAISHDQAELTKIAHDALAHERSGRGFMYRLVKFVTGAKGG